MNDFATSPLAVAMGWSLIHFLWQGTLVAAIVWFTLAICPRKNSNLRYIISCAGIGMMLLCPIVTTLYLLPQSSATMRTTVVRTTPTRHGIQDFTVGERTDQTLNLSGKEAGGMASQFDPNGFEHSDSNDLATEPAIESARSTEAFFGRLTSSIEFGIPWLVSIWALGVFLLSLRLIVGWRAVQKLRFTGRATNNQTVLAILDDLKSKVCLRVSIPIRESAEILSPMVIGWIKPVILFPACAITKLSPDQLTAILAHELAHIRRADYLVNLIQSAIEIILFYHPGVWWISAQIRRERENCCDDLAVQICENKHDYIEALLQLEKSRKVSLAMASNGANLVDRIARMLGQDRKSAAGGWIAAFASMILICSVFAISISPRTADGSSQADVEETSRVQDEDSGRVEEKQKLLVEALAPDKTPLQGINITLGVWYQQTANTENFVTDENGIAEITLPEDLKIVRLWASGSGYTRLFANWEDEEFEGGASPLPEKFTFKMVQAIPIGGTVLDENQNPISGVSVEVRRVTRNDKPDQRTRFGTWFAEGPGAQVTDENGQWTLNNIPPGDDIELSLRFTHSDYIGDENWGGLQGEQALGQKALRDKTARIVLQKGIKIRGRLTNEDGDPIKDAMIVWGDDPYLQPGRQEVLVEDDGTYELPSQRNGDLRVTAIAPDFAPQSRIVDVQPDMDPEDFSMTPGQSLMIKFVDEIGEPVPNVYVGIRKWRGSSSLFNHQHPNVYDTRIPRQSNANGVYTWDWAPEDKVTYAFYARGYLEKREMEFAPDEKAHTVVFTKQAEISGTVTDESGKPVKSFRVIPRYHLNEKITSAQRQDSVAAKNGEFRIKLDGREGTYSLTVEADGFASQNTETFERDSRPAPFHLKLKKAANRRTHVVDAEGKPVANAIIVVAPTDQVITMRGFNDRTLLIQSLNTTTDERGEFALNDSQVPRTIIAFSDEGYGEILDSQESPVESITLKKWANLKGTAKLKGQPWMVRASYRQIRLHNGKFFHVQNYLVSASSQAGGFALPKIAAMPAAVDIYGADDPLGRRYMIPISPQPGQELQLDFNNATPVTGTVSFTGKNLPKVDYSTSKFELRKVEPSIEIPGEAMELIAANQLDPLDFDAVFQQFSPIDFIHAQYAYSSCFDTYRGSLSNDGTFSFDVLRPGKYVLSIKAIAKSKSKFQTTSMSEFRQVIEVTKDAVELGEISVALLDEPELNSPVENLAFTNLENKATNSIEGFRGSYLLMDFWSPYCDECEKATPKIQRLAGIIARKGKVKLLSLKSSGSGPVERMPEVIPDGLTWINGQLKHQEETSIRTSLGVWNSQHFVLLDADGRFVFSGTFAQLVKKLDELDLK